MDLHVVMPPPSPSITTSTPSHPMSPTYRILSFHLYLCILIYTNNKAVQAPAVRCTTPLTLAFFSLFLSRGYMNCYTVVYTTPPPFLFCLRPQRQELLSNAASATKLRATLNQQHELYAAQQQAARAYQARAALQHAPAAASVLSPPAQSDWSLRSQSRYQVSFSLD